MSLDTPSSQPQNQNVSVQIKYDDMTARYASHALLNNGNEEVYIEFSSGVVVDRASGGAVLPIHTRIAMTPAGVVRLWQLLGQAVQNFQVVQAGARPPAPASSFLPAEPIVPPGYGGTGEALPPLSSILPDEPIVPPDMQGGQRE